MFLNSSKKKEKKLQTLIIFCEVDNGYEILIKMSVIVNKKYLFRI
jgi:hypothetical protein